MRTMAVWAGTVVLLALPATAGAVEPSQDSLDEAVRLGTVAALAPLCGLREEAWAFDLRRAAILEATRTDRPEDPALKHTPGSELVVGALSFAEAEALEDFAEGTPDKTCGPLRGSADLARADGLVERFRELKSRLKPAS